MARSHGSSMRKTSLRVLPPSVAGALLIAAALIATGPISTNDPSLLNPSPEPHAVISSIPHASTAHREHEARPALAEVLPTRERANRLT